MTSSVVAIVAVLVLALALVFAGACGAPQGRVAAVECDAEAVAKIAPQIKGAVEAKDYARLASLLVEFGAEAYACGHKELAKQAVSTAPDSKDGAQ